MTARPPTRNKTQSPMIYVLSDIHGNERRFNSILKQIDLQQSDTLYILGDVIDRHPGGIQILRRIMAMPNAKMLLGNHEYMMLRALGCPYDDYRDDGGAMGHWYRNGGGVTHWHLKWLRKSVRAEIADYLRSLPLHFDITVNDRAYKLVHGAPIEACDRDPKYRNPTHFAVWKRLESSETVPGEYTLIFGHTPTRYYQDCVPMEIWQESQKIGIDCGSGYPDGNPMGRLACLRLDDGAVFYSEEPG